MDQASRDMADRSEDEASRPSSRAGTNGNERAVTTGVDTKAGGSRAGVLTGKEGKRTDTQPYFKSRRIKKGEQERPWLKKKTLRDHMATIIPCFGLLIGIGVCVFLIWDGMMSVTHNKYCSIFEDDFSSGFDDNKWMKEVEVGGFGQVHRPVCEMAC
jgi:hypothetical protein